MILNRLLYKDNWECTTDGDLEPKCPRCHSFDLYWDRSVDPPVKTCLPCGWYDNPGPDMFIKVDAQLRDNNMGRFERGSQKGPKGEHNGNNGNSKFGKGRRHS